MQTLHRGRAIRAALLFALVVSTASFFVGTAAAHAGGDAWRNAEHFQQSPSSSTIGATDAGGITLTTIDDVFSRISAAKTITVVAFSLTVNAPITQALITAANRGARVDVALDGKAFGAYIAENAETAKALTAAGATVRYTKTASHIKIIDADGVLVLSDRNFSAGRSTETLLLDTVPGDRTLILRSVFGQTSGNDHLWTKKDDALGAEATLIGARGSHDLSVSTESFGASKKATVERDHFDDVLLAMLGRARAGDRVRLIVAARESNRDTIGKVCDAGGSVADGHADEKLALDGDTIWTGSANLTQGVPDQVDFGLVVQDDAIARELHARFDAEWAHARLICGER